MMTQEERFKRFEQRHAEELAKADLGLWWLSFVDPDRPVGDRFAGVVILEAYGFADAIEHSHMMGLNPGGEVQGLRVDPAEHPESLRNRLLSKADLAGFGVSSRKEA